MMYHPSIDRRWSNRRTRRLPAVLLWSLVAPALAAGVFFAWWLS